MITGNTAVAGLIGYPARYSMSPALHNAAYADLHIDAVYAVFPTEPGELQSAVAGIKAMNMLGVSVTIPHKESVIQWCDELTDAAQLLQAVNCLKVEGTSVIGHNTDGAGFIRSLQHDLDFVALGKKCVVIGGGGAAKAVVQALHVAGAIDVAVINRSTAQSLERARATAALAQSVGRVGDYSDVEQADLIVNATPLGMTGENEQATPLPDELVHGKQVVVDLIYSPRETLFLKNCRDRGVRTANGLGMLIHQAALQIEWWTGKVPNINVMQKAVSND